MILSIVIPIYGVEKYIEKCLMSCINQDIKLGYDYEIVCINDGTKDKSAEIAKRIAADHKGIIVIDQENGGLSVARNNGLMIAKGDYVWFVDSDDYIEENCLGRIVSYLKEDLDILQLQYRHVFEDDTPAIDMKFCNVIGVKTGLEVIEEGGLPAPAQFSIIRTRFLNEYNLNFVKGIYHEDIEFKPRVTYLAKRIKSDSEISYNYLQRVSGNIMSNFKLKNAIDIIKAINSLLDFSDKYGISSRYRRHLYRLICMNLNSLLFHVCDLSDEDKILLIQELRNNRRIFDCMIHTGKLKYQIEGLLLKMNVSLGVFFHQHIRYKCLR